MKDESLLISLFGSVLLIILSSKVDEPNTEIFFAVSGIVFGFVSVLAFAHANLNEK